MGRNHTDITAWIEDADAVSLQRIDEADGLPRPAHLGTLYVEKEYAALADEQEHLWTAEGKQAAVGSRAQARGLDQIVKATEFLLREREDEVHQARTDYLNAMQVLSTYIRREPGAKLRYLIGFLVLWFGDTAGIWSAAIINGDLPSVAFGQAFAAGLAAACAGLIGTELKHFRLARARQRDDLDALPDGEQRYRHLFTGGRGGLGVVKLIAALSGLVVVLVAVGIGLLRTSIEGDTAGRTFALMAAGTAIGSLLLGYAAADDIADLLARMNKRVTRAEKRYLALAGSHPASRQASAEATAASIEAEYRMRGLAAAMRIEALGHRVLRRNPQVAGHGYPSGDSGGVIGRRLRRDGVRS